MTNGLTRSDLFDIDRKTGALILGKNRLDDYATKYLSKYCPEALERPMPLPVEGILKKQNLTIKEVSLSRNLDVFGCCLMLDGEVEIYNRTNNTVKTETFTEGTILIDPESEALHGEGAKRNTLIHEALHWEKDKKYFEILALKNTAMSEKLYPIMCRQSGMFYEPSVGKKTKENQVRWLEWQANRLAPRVLMPALTFKQKALEIIASHQSTGHYLSCDILIEELSSFFIVSRASVKYRLIEVGLIDQISKFEDYDAVFSDINNTKEFAAITPVDAYDLLSSNSSLKEWVNGDRFVFADGYFVIAKRDYVTLKPDGLHLTEKAKRNLARCVINIHELKYSAYPNIQKDFVGFAVLYKVEGIDKRLYVYHPQFQPKLDYDEDEVYDAACEKILSYNDDEEIQLAKMLGDPTASLCQCLWYLMQNRKWRYPSTFSEKTGLHQNYHGEIKNNKKNNMDRDTLMAVCVGLKLTITTVESIFKKSKNKLNRYSDPDKTYIRIIEQMPGLSLQDFNEILQRKGLKELGSSMREN